MTMNPGRELYDSVRAGLVKQRTSLNAWCKRNKIKRGHAVAALMGYSDDAKLVSRLKAAAEIQS